MPFQLSVNREGIPVGSKDAPLPVRGDPDGQPDTFLRQKEAQLREKRAREKDGGETRDSNDGSSISTNSSKSPITNINGSSRDNINSSSSALSLNTNSLVNNTRQSKSPSSSQQQQQSTPQIHKLRSSANTTSNTGSDNNQISHSASPSHSVISPHSSSGSNHQKSPGQFVTGSKSDSHVAALRNQGDRIPQFYFPSGHSGDGPGGGGIEDTLSKIKDVFTKLEAGKATRQTMGEVAKVRLLFFCCNFIRI